MSFALDQRLAHDTFVVGDMTLTRVLLMNDARWPWLILAPRREGLAELTDLDPGDRTQLIEEAARASRFLKAHAGADRINIGVLGNIVRQLHLHVVARTIGDIAWPAPVGGHGVQRPYQEDDARALITAAKNSLGL
jgi:diadenosine tetraphosphate (Ap4A) HIT family hydrolase